LWFVSPEWEKADWKIVLKQILDWFSILFLDFTSRCDIFLKFVILFNKLEIKTVSNNPKKVVE